MVAGGKYLDGGEIDSGREIPVRLRDGFPGSPYLLVTYGPDSVREGDTVDRRVRYLMAEDLERRMEPTVPQVGLFLAYAR